MNKVKKKQKPVFAQNVISRRKSLGWNAHKLAEQAEIPYPTLRDIEAGINNGREETKAAIAKALGISVAELYINKSKKETLLPDFNSAGVFLSKLSSLSPRRQKAVLGLVYDNASYMAEYPDLSQKYEALLKIL